MIFSSSNRDRIGTRLGKGIINTVASIAQSAAVVRATYGINTLSTIIVPDVGAILAAIVGGHITRANAVRDLAFHGVDLSNASWPEVLESMKSWPSADEAVSAFWRDRGLYNNTLIQKWVKANGYTDIDAYNFLFEKPHIWTPDECRVLESVGAITNTDANKWIKSAGIVRPDDRAAFDKLILPPSVGDILQLSNREEISNLEMHNWLRLNGLTDNDVRNSIIKLKDRIPSPSALVEFAVKEVWNQAIVNKFGYDDEFSQIPQYNYWMKKQGYGGSPSTGPNDTGSPATWAQAWWRAHWRVISNSQAYQMLHRLRPTGGANGGARVPVVPGTTTAVGPVTIGDVEAVLKVNDYPPFWRDRLAALSFNVMRLVDINRIVVLSMQDSAFKSQAIGSGFTIKQWAKENYLDRGQTPADAESLSTLAMARGQAIIDRPNAIRRKIVRERQVRNTQAQYKIGIIDDRACTSLLKNYGYTADQATAVKTEIDVERNIECVRLNVNRIKREFLKGKIDKVEAANELHNSGIISVMQDWYIKCWTAELGTYAIQSATIAIRDNLKDGLITEGDALAQLKNLGWNNADALLEITKIELEIIGA